MKGNIWEALKDALRGTEEDYTKISLKKAIFLLAVPMILELVMESTFAVVDIFFVGKLGAEAVATVGLTETYLFLIYSLAMGLSMGVTAIVARRIGEKNLKDASLSGNHAILIAIFCAIPFSLAGILYSKELLGLMGADTWALTEGYKYTQWMLGGNAVIMLLFVINAIYRGAGDASIAMKVLWVSNGLNMILDPLLIFGWGPIPAMGIEGAAIATNLGRGTGVLIQLWVLFRGSRHLKSAWGSFRWSGAMAWNILKTSSGGVMQMLISMTSWIFLMRILSDVGSSAVAGATISIRIMMFTLMPAWGLSNAAATLVGQNLGAKQPDRAESTVWKIGYYNMAFLILVSIIFFFARESLMRIFTSDIAVIQIGAEWLKILSFSYFIYGWWMVAVQAFNGAGDTQTPTKINVVFFWLIQIPLAYLLAIYYNWEASGVFWAVFFSETAVGIFTLWLFSKGKWKTAQV